MPSQSSVAAATLPDEVAACLQNARFLHLATVADNTPHISLMNYTYLPTSPFDPTTPTIVMTTLPDSRKTENLASNPHVSLLVHDWISHRPPTLAGNPQSSSLAALLQGINTASLGRISSTINGVAEMVAPNTEQEAWYKARHIANNTFSDDDGASGGVLADASLGEQGAAQGAAEGDGGKCYVQGDEVRVVVVRIRDGKISDWKGGVRDWTISGDQGGGAANGAG